MNDITKPMFEGTLWLNINIALSRVDVPYRNLARRYDMSVIEMYIILAVSKDRKLRPGQISQKLKRDNSSISPYLKHLVRSGYLEEALDIVSKASKRLSLTEKGGEAYDEISIEIRRIDAELMTNVSVSDISGFYKVLNVLINR